MSDVEPHEYHFLSLLMIRGFSLAWRFWFYAAEDAAPKVSEKFTFS